MYSKRQISKLHKLNMIGVIFIVSVHKSAYYFHWRSKRINVVSCPERDITDVNEMRKAIDSFSIENIIFLSMNLSNSIDSNFSFLKRITQRDLTIDQLHKIIKVQYLMEITFFPDIPFGYLSCLYIFENGLKNRLKKYHVKFVFMWYCHREKKSCMFWLCFNNV